MYIECKYLHHIYRDIPSKVSIYFNFAKRANSTQAGHKSGRFELFVLYLFLISKI